jgi:predicted transcriptional regulator
MEALQRLFKLRQSLYENETALGIDDYSDIERAVLEFVVSQEFTTISKILKQPYFAKISLSTINRVVARLLSDGAIKSEQSSKDKREMNLSFCLEN